MKLTAEQIDQLYAFTRQHYVEYYDLQTELVDHLANAIEQQWQESPNISFEEALQVEFKKFGIFGFTTLVEKREMTLNKKYRKIVFQHFNEFFKLPKIIGSLLAVWVFHFSIVHFQHTINIINIVPSTLFAICFIGMIALAIKKRRDEKRSGKKWLFKKVLLTGYSVVFAQWYWIYKISGGSSSGQHSDWVYWFFSVVWVVMILLEFIIFIVIPSKAEQYLKETYPEYGIAD